MVTVYDPDTLRAVKVPEDDTRAVDYLSRAEAQRERREQRQTRKKIEDKLQDAAANVAQSTLQNERVRNVGTRAAGAVTAGASRVAAAGRAAGALAGGSAASGVAALGVGGTAAAVGAALALGYAIGTAGLTAWRRLQPSEIAYRRANAFRRARQEFAEKYGRPPNPEEVRAMSQGFRQAYERAQRSRR